MIRISLSEFYQDTKRNPSVKEMKKISKGTYDYHFSKNTFLSKECLPLQINMTIIDDDLNSAKWLKYMYRVNMWRTILQ